MPRAVMKFCTEIETPPKGLNDAGFLAAINDFNDAVVSAMKAYALLYGVVLVPNSRIEMRQGALDDKCELWEKCSPAMRALCDAEPQHIEGPPCPAPSAATPSGPEPHPPWTIIEKLIGLAILGLTLYVLFGGAVFATEQKLVVRGPLARTLTSCELVGDSILVAVADLIPECDVNARIGASAEEIIERVGHAERVVISAGSNNERTPGDVLDFQLEEIRNQALRHGAKRIVWVLPSSAPLRAVVGLVALSHGDQMVSFTPGGLHGQAHVHPGCVACLVIAIRNALNVTVLPDKE